MKALQKQGRASVSMSAPNIRKIAQSLATETVEKQKEGFKKWAVMGDWDNPYISMSREFELRQLDIFKNMVEHGTSLSAAQMFWPWENICL